jgi:hypothetical protein
MKEFTASAYLFRMFDLFFGLRDPHVIDRLTENEKRDLRDFCEKFDALPWQPLPSHPHISFLSDDNFRSILIAGKRLDHRLWLRVGDSVVPFFCRFVRGWMLTKPKTTTEPTPSPNR